MQHSTPPFPNAIRKGGVFFWHEGKGLSMHDRPANNRRGISRTLTLDYDSSELLRELAPGPRHQGRYISDLIRQEYARREERRRIRETLADELARACG
jgi:hypothetical protein